MLEKQARASSRNHAEVNSLSLPRLIRLLLTRLGSTILLVALSHASQPSAQAQQSQWVRPAKPGDPLIWGRRDGIVFGLSSPGGIRGPRGLIRVGPYLPNDVQGQLLNFIAVEPVVEGPGWRGDRMAFSELEPSTLDPGQNGKRMWVPAPSSPAGSVTADPIASGTLQSFHPGDATVERLSVRINVEKFTANGAHVYLIASIDSDKPEELRLSVHAEDDSPPLEELTLTATMGNFERLRLLWLKDKVINSHQLFHDYTGTEFDEKEPYQLPELLRTGEGDAIVYASSDEANPKESPGNSTNHWIYPLPKLTQYWRVPGHDVQPDLRLRVNARRIYWASNAPVLGGIAFENFELRQRYIPGQSFIFGISRKEPWQIYRGTTPLAPAQDKTHP